MKYDFKLGDKLLLLKGLEGNSDIKGKIGTVVDILPTHLSAPKIGLAFKEKLGTLGHDCNGHCKDKHGWYCYADDLIANAKKLKVNKVETGTKLIIYAQGNVVIAKLIQDKKSLAQATAKCSPEDVFDILVGAQVALCRLARKNDSKIVLPKDIFKDVEFI